MSEHNTATKVAAPAAALLYGLGPLGALHAGTASLTQQGHGPASSITAIHLTAAVKRAVTDQQWVTALIDLMEHQLGTTPSLAQMLGVAPGLPGGKLANQAGFNAIKGFYCATWASYVVALTYHSFGLTSPIYGGSSFKFNLPDWSIIRVLNDGNGDATSLQQWGQETNRYHPGPDVTPKPGWLILLRFPGDQHVEVVTKVVGNQVLTIGGNTGPDLNVARDSWQIGNPDIVGYADPTPHMGLVSVPIAMPGTPSGPTAAAIPPAPVLTIPGATLLAVDSPAAAGESLAIPGLDSQPMLDQYAQQPRPALHVPKPNLRHRAHRSPSASGTRFAPSLTRPVGDTAAQQQWLMKFLPDARAAQAKYHIAVAVQFAQLIDEAGWNNYSKLAAPPYFNPFGMKAIPGYRTVTMPTQEQAPDGSWYWIDAPFTWFDSYQQAFEAHAYQFVDPGGYYAQYLPIIQGHTLTSDVVNEYTLAIAHTYATSHDYGPSLVALMKQLDLYRYDAAPAPYASSAPGHQPGPRASRPSVRRPPVTRPSTASSATPGLVIPPPDLPTAPAAGGAEIPVPGVSTTGVPASTITVPPAAADYEPVSRSASPATADVVGAIRIKATLAVHDTHLVLPPHVGQTLVTKAQTSLRNNRSLYESVARTVGIHDWRLVAALDWVNTRGDLRMSPYMEGEHLRDSGFNSREEALFAAAMRLRKTARLVYGLDLAKPDHLTVEQVAQVYAAYRWGSVLRDAPKPVTALALPYAAKGLSRLLIRQPWPEVEGAPESHEYSAPHGAMAVVYHLGYPAVL